MARSGKGAGTVKVSRMFEPPNNASRAHKILPYAGGAATLKPWRGEENSTIRR